MAPRQSGSLRWKDLSRCDRSHDVGSRTIETFVDEEIANLRERLLAYDIIAAVDVRALLWTVDFDPGERRLGGHAPGWTDPWTRVQALRVVEDGWKLLLADDRGYHVPDLDVQLARLALP